MRQRPRDASVSLGVPAPQSRCLGAAPAPWFRAGGSRDARGGHGARCHSGYFVTCRRQGEGTAPPLPPVGTTRRRGETLSPPRCQRERLPPCLSFPFPPRRCSTAHRGGKWGCPGRGRVCGPISCDPPPGGSCQPQRWAVALVTALSHGVPSPPWGATPTLSPRPPCSPPQPPCPTGAAGGAAPLSPRCGAGDREGFGGSRWGHESGWSHQVPRVAWLCQLR